MKRFICLLIASVFVLGGCAGGYVPHGGNYSLSDGRYVTSTSMLPYLLFNEGGFTVIKDVAVSYQPSGTVRRDGNSVTLEGKFADADFRYSFVLTSDDTLLFDLGASILPMSASDWYDGMIFTLADDTSTGTDDGLDRVEQVGVVPAEFEDIVRENRFKNAVAFSDRLLKAETVSFDSEDKTVEYKITMTDLYGEPLAVFSVTADKTYHVDALTATDDGGFLFVLGFSDCYYYDNGAWASADGYASHVIKCDKGGKVEFDTSLVGVEGYALSYCFEKSGNYYLFGTRYVPDVREYTGSDVFLKVIDGTGAAINEKQIGGGDFDNLENAEETEDGFLLSVSAQSDDGDFEGSDSGGYPVNWTVRINDSLEITEKKKETGREFTDRRRIGEKDGKPVFRSDPVFDGFDAGLPTAFIDYGDFYLIVSEHITGDYENTPPYISRVLHYTETVYSGYDRDGNLLFRASVDSSREYATDGSLEETYPEYFGLDAKGGLDVIVWQLGDHGYHFCLLEHSETERDWLDPELLILSTKGVDAEEMRQILSTYNVSEDDIHIIPWQNPISSYIPLVFTDDMTEEEKAETTERYIDGIREMLFG